MSYLDEKFNSIDEKFNSIDEKLDSMMSSLDAKLDSMKSDLLSCNAEATMELIQPAVVNSHSIETQADLDDSDPTWTYMRNGKNQLIAVGSVRCGLYYATHSTKQFFVNLPLEIIKQGVKRIGFIEPKTITNPIQTQYDIMCVELLSSVDTLQKTVTKYEAFDEAKMPSKVAGQSNINFVSGKYCVYDRDENYLVFVEDFGPPGNSGTLMFGWKHGTDPKPIGTYVGSAEKNDNTRRARGFIAPLPNYDDFVWYYPTNKPLKKLLLVQDTAGPRKCRLFGSSSKDCFLQDGSEEWPGVILKIDPKQGNPRIFFCGSSDTGSCRCK